ncbi:Hypothetical predicted protein [Octopus vulgaris]|uniref:Uncharacterized protein n=1 Tax=Octopus vulgaris TaxID=6645 RepID=A0AA36AJC9_OCTVU|nr:Hypothetical predicted protein [Octopus vulgaris]
MSTSLCDNTDSIQFYKTTGKRKIFVESIRVVVSDGGCGGGGSDDIFQIIVFAVVSYTTAIQPPPRLR